MDEPVCFKCHRPCDNSLSVAYRFYHPSCFSCEDCQEPLAYNYHIADDRVLCERDYKLRRGIICKRCYRLIAPSDKTTGAGAAHAVGRYKYHDTCMKCAVCKKSSKKQQQSKEWYVHNNQAYCRYHYSLLHAPICPGCQQAVLSKGAATADPRWHHECYMIQKYWNIQLSVQQQPPSATHRILFPPPVEEQLRRTQAEMDQRRKQVWEEMRAFEDSLATCIWDMALHITAGAVAECLQMASQLTWHLKILLAAHQAIHHRNDSKAQEETECDALCRNVCLRVIQFYGLVHKHQSEIPKQVVTFVANLAAQLKALLRTGLLEALHSDQERVFDKFLSPFLHLKKQRLWVSGRFWFQGSPFDFSRSVLTGELCATCGQLVDSACFRFGRIARWHRSCLVCQACRSHISEPQNARIGQSNDNADLLLLCEECTRNPDNRRSYIMQQRPPVRVSQIEQCLFLLCINLARVQEYKMMFTTTKGIGLLNDALLVDDDDAHSNSGGEPATTTLLRRTMTATKVRSKDQDGTAATTATAAAAAAIVGVRRAASLGRRRIPEPIQQISHPFPLVKLSDKQDFAVRHLAVVLCLERRLITMEDVPALLHMKKAISLWSKLKKTTLRGTGSVPPTMQAYKTFGVPLASQQFSNPDWAFVQTLADKYPSLTPYYSSHARIPPVVQNCILALMESDMKVEGLFRKNGNFRELNEICAKVDAGERYWEYLKKTSAVQLAALLKRFFRDLPEPLLTYKLRRVFLAAIRAESMADTKRLLHFAYCVLPKPNRDVTLLLFTFLKYLVTHFGDVTLMHTDNIARVFTPSIFYPESQQHRNTSPEDIAVVKLLITNIDEFSVIPEDFIEYLRDETMIKLLTTNDVISSKEFLRICGNVVKLARATSDKTRSAIVLPTSTASSSSSSVATAPPPPAPQQLSPTSAKSMQVNLLRRSIWSDH